MAIIASRANGVETTELARRYGVSRQTISTVLSKLRNAPGHQEAKQEFDSIVYRNRLRRKAHDAVEAGLDCEEDQYKRGNLGVQWLKGVGDLQPDGPTFNLATFIANRLPDDLGDDLVMLPEGSLIDGDEIVTPDVEVPAIDATDMTTPNSEVTS